MLEKVFAQTYQKFKLQFYSKVFGRFHSREASLTVVETFCVEVINLLDRPTIHEFAEFTQISAPNAAYKVNSLVKKGYIRKVQSAQDKREFFLEVTNLFFEYYSINANYMDVVIQRVRDRFPEEDLAVFEKILSTMSRELMPEINLPDHTGRVGLGEDVNLPM